LEEKAIVSIRPGVLFVTNIVSSPRQYASEQNRKTDHLSPKGRRENEKDCRKGQAKGFATKGISSTFLKKKKEKKKFHEWSR
jgi:hypothetical protein